MKIALGSDERTALTDALREELQRRGHDVALYGPPAGPSAGNNIEWPDVAASVARAVASGEHEQAILCCWTGTGVSIAANKIAGVRAALCGDAETARGARRWNDANVLCLSLRATSPTIAMEILDAWFYSHPEESEAANIQKVREMDGERPPS